MEFAPAIDPRLRASVGRIVDLRSSAAVWRELRRRARHFGTTTPCYESIRKLVIAERERRARLLAAITTVLEIASRPHSRSPGARSEDLPPAARGEPRQAMGLSRRRARTRRRAATVGEKARAAFRRPSIPVASVGFGRGASYLSPASILGPGPAARNARPLRSAMAIPQWVSGTRLYPLVPPLPVLQESVTSGPPPFRGKTECIPRPVDDGKFGKPYRDPTRRRRPCRRPDAHRVRVDRDIRRQSQRAARLDVEPRAVTRADHDPLAAVEVALTERAVVVRAPVLEREELAVAVVDADERSGATSTIRTVPGGSSARGQTSISAIAIRRRSRRSRCPTRPGAACPSPCSGQP